ncbi:MAG: hypothetical protein HN929_06480 [Chloroflexi bacterium]|mgnify:CR=1 FL=1|jgi:geranylgeranyl pyrophosphate synthase|nr:hypothetical protein [Chloroflexota bacterium]MBT7081097.1 hypothetical protein [Chloroflexota bacterium]MBT7289467.1 hypothetical protein [Chloroflexota bacterium]
MLQKIAHLLKQEIEELIASLPGDSSFKQLIQQPLMGPGRPLSESGYRSSLLPVLISQSVCDGYEHVLPLSAAICFMQTAADVFDDVEDQDSKSSLIATAGYAQAVNIATALLLLAQLAMVRLKTKNVDNGSIVSIIAEISKYGIMSCTGQYLDIKHKSNTDITEDQYLDMVALKSAPPMECACLTAAMLSTDNQNLIDAFARFGHNIGMATQLVNDIHGITKSETGKSDIIAKQVTLPIIYALENAEGNDLELLSSIYKGSDAVTPQTEKQVIKLLFDTGAIHYTVVTMELYRQKALATLKQAAKYGSDTKTLTGLVESLQD